MFFAIVNVSLRCNCFDPLRDTIRPLSFRLFPTEPFFFRTACHAQKLQTSQTTERASVFQRRPHTLLQLISPMRRQSSTTAKSTPSPDLMTYWRLLRSESPLPVQKQLIHAAAPRFTPRQLVALGVAFGKPSAS